MQGSMMHLHDDVRCYLDDVWGCAECPAQCAPVLVRDPGGWLMGGMTDWVEASRWSPDPQCHGWGAPSAVP